jgi:hypothetical protein
MEKRARARWLQPPLRSRALWLELPQPLGTAAAAALAAVLQLLPLMLLVLMMMFHQSLPLFLPGPLRPGRR